MKRIVSLLLSLALCAGLCAALDVSVSAANEMEKRTVSFPEFFAENAEETMTCGDITIKGNLGFHCYTSFERGNYSFVVSVPENCLITQVTYNLGNLNRWPSVSVPYRKETKATISKPDGRTLVVSYKPEDNVHATELYGLESEGDEDPYRDQEVKSLTVEYLAPHTHQKDVNAYHAAVQPTCCAGNVEYWDCTYSECDAKLDANGNVIEDVTVPPILEHSVDNYDEVTSSTCKTPGEEKGVCTVCNETVTREIPIDPDAHIYSTEWVFDKDYHWHESTCEVCGHSDKDDCLNHDRDLSRSGYPCRVCGAEIPWWYGSILSQGSIWIVSGVAVLAAAAVLTLIVVKKKKSAAASSSEE